MITMKKILLAYLAGAIDSDGTIGIKKSTYHMRRLKDAGQPTYSERTARRQVTSEITSALREAFGGSVYMTAPSAPRGRPLFSWAVTDLKACACLNTLLPFLRVKHAQALNALALRPLKIASLRARLATGRGHVGGAARPKEIGDRIKEYAQQQAQAEKKAA